MRRSDQKSFGVDIDSELLDKFTEQYNARGFKKYRALEGAMRLWITLTSAEQNQWIEGANSKPLTKKEEVDKLVAGLVRFLQSQGISFQPPQETRTKTRHRKQL